MSDNRCLALVHERIKGALSLSVLSTKHFIYGTTQFKLDICMRVLVQSFEKFATELASFPQAHDPWHAFDPCDELYSHEVHLSVAYFTREQSRYV